MYVYFAYAQYPSLAIYIYICGCNIWYILYRDMNMDSEWMVKRHGL